MADQAYRLASVIGALSIATDHGAGQPAGVAMGAAVIAVRLGRKKGLSTSDLKALYFGTTLAFIGCTSTSTDVSELAFGEDNQAAYAMSLCDWRDPVALRKSLEDNFNPAVSEAEKQTFIDAICEGIDVIPTLTVHHCAQAELLSAELPVPAQTAVLLRHRYGRWDGNYPGPAGAEVPEISRLCTLAITVELFRRTGGIPACIETLGQRRGGQFDPDLCDLFLNDPEEIFSSMNVSSALDLYLAEEPGEPIYIGPAQRTEIAENFSDFVDQKSGWMLGHSRAVASLALRVATELNMPQEERQKVYLAGLLHDIGRAAVPNRVWEKNGELTSSERREAERHSFHTESILAETEIFADLVAIADSVHERQDASGYHRRGRLEDVAASCLAVADVYCALINRRSWRKAYTPDDAADKMLDEVTQGRFPSQAVQALLKVCGHDKQAANIVYPAGLTSREIDILRCLISGMGNNQIADDLGISPKTAENHLTQIYRKTKTSGRTQAALFAMKHGIFAH